MFYQQGEILNPIRLKVTSLRVRLNLMMCMCHGASKIRFTTVEARSLVYSVFLQTIIRRRFWMYKSKS